MEEVFDVVDRNVEVIREGLKEGEFDINNDITRVVTLYLFDVEDNFVICQRVETKKVDPLLFEAPAHGKVRSGESYTDAIMREAQEELEITPSGIEEIKHFYYSFDSNAGRIQHFKTLYVGSTTDELKPNYDEIKSVKLFSSFEHFRTYYHSHKKEFSNSMKFDMEALEDYFKRKEQIS